MSRYRYIMLLCAVALVLTGCGGGGDSGVDQSTHEMLQTELDAALAQLMEEEEARKTAEAALATTRLSVTALEAQIGAATDAANDSATASLHAQLNAAKARVATLTAEIGTAADSQSLRGMLEAEKVKVTRLTAELQAANTSLTSLRGQLTTAQQAVVTAQQQAAQQVQAAQQQAQQQVQAEIERRTQGAEASQRARHLQAAFPIPPVDAATYTSPASPVVSRVPTRGSMELTRGTSFRRATLGGSGLRSTTMALTSTVNTGKTVVYTDRELSRELLVHFGMQRVSPSDNMADPNALQFNAAIAATLGLTIGTTADDEPPANTSALTDVIRPITSGTSIGVSVSHGFGGSISPTARTEDGVIYRDNDNDATNDWANVQQPTGMRYLTRKSAFFSGTVHGVGGRFQCVGVNCMVVLKGDYNPNVEASVDPDENRLERVTISATSGFLQFRPTSRTGSFSLCDDLATCTGGTDQEYMLFGYWREDPTSPASPYDAGAIGVFAGAESRTDDYAPDSADISATYRGTAAGLYIEQEQSDPVDVHRQGEFVANAILTVDDAAPSTITGTIRDFRTTPTGGSAQPESAGRWVVELDPLGVVVLNNQSGTTSGAWDYEYVEPHEHASDTTPPAVTGTFNARLGTIARDPNTLAGRVVGDALHIIGAFGAHR